MSNNDNLARLIRWGGLLTLCLGLAGCSTLRTGALSGASSPSDADQAETAAARPMPTADSAATTVTAQPAPDPEPAPLPGIWQRVRAGFGLPHHADHPRVAELIRYYGKNPEAFHALLERGQPYLHLVMEAVQARGLPTELALLPYVESAYTPSAHSHRRAAGLWQFMPATGRQYGLHRNWWYDGRRDVLASTEAALEHLERLHRRFDGDWLLALAAYNMGGNGLARRLPDDPDAAAYWHLTLPRETTRYIPKLLALAAVLTDPEAHGLTLPDIPDAPQVKPIELAGQVDLNVVAEAGQLEPAALHALNSGFLQRVTAPEGPHRMLVPADAAERIQTHLASLPQEEWVRWRRYRIRRGDALVTLARRFNTTVDALRAVNGILGHRIVAGATLLIPNSAQGVPAEGTVTHTVRPGDSLWSVSRQYRVPMHLLADVNELAAPEHLRVGQQLRIPRQLAATEL